MAGLDTGRGRGNDGGSGNSGLCESGSGSVCIGTGLGLPSGEDGVVHVCVDDVAVSSRFSVCASLSPPLTFSIACLPTSLGPSLPLFFTPSRPDGSLPPVLKTIALGGPIILVGFKTVYGATKGHNEAVGEMSKKHVVCTSLALSAKSLMVLMRMTKISRQPWLSISQTPCSTMAQSSRAFP